MQYRKFILNPGQMAPYGSTGKILTGNFIVWAGEQSDFPQEIESYAMTQAEIFEFIKRDLEIALDNHITAIAKAKGYDDRISCTVRAGYVNPWQAEGIAFGTWMDSCYTTAHQIMADVQAGTREIPTTEQLISELPLMVWPE